MELAHARGAVPTIRKTDRAVVLAVPGNKRKVTLVKGDGTVTNEGKVFYEMERVPPPRAYPYEQPLLHGKWVINFDGSKTLVRRMNAQGEWVPTKNGTNYFKYNQVYVEAIIPVFEAFPRKTRPGESMRYWIKTIEPKTWSSNNCTMFDDGRPSNTQLSIGYTRTSGGRIATEAQQDAHARSAVEEWIARQRTVTSIDNVQWHIVGYDSPAWLVHDPSRNIRIIRTMDHVYTQSAPSADTILNRPMADIATPEGCWRSYDLHPATFDNTGMCVVHMLHTSFLLSVVKRVGKKTVRVKEPAMTIQQIEKDMDMIFKQLLYKEEDFPYEHGWRQDGCTPDMVETFCQIHKIKYIARQGRNVLKTYTPPGATNCTPTVHFTVFANHAYWYGKAIDAPPDKRLGANNSAAQSKRKAATSADGDLSEKKGVYQGRELKPVFGQDKIPPFSEWHDEHILTDAMCHNWEPFRTKRELHKRRKHEGEKLYFWTHDLQRLEEDLRREQMKSHNFDVTSQYGQSPEHKVRLLVDAGSQVPRLVIVKIPREHEHLAQICKHVTKALQLDDGAFMYKGQSRAQIGERLRLLLSKVKRTNVDNETANRILIKQGRLCSLCNCELQPRGGGGEGAMASSLYQIDHIRPISDGGSENDATNLQALCLPCHSQKTNEERLGALYTKPLFSRFNRDLLEGFLAAPKPRQLVFGSGSGSCFEIDAIQCRTNALAKNTKPLPMFHVIDNFEAFQPGKTADFYYIDAGPPLEDPVKALPYLGPGWYWCENYTAIMQSKVSSSRGGPITDTDVVCTLTASEHAPADAMTPIFANMTALVLEALIGFEVVPLGSVPFTPAEPMTESSAKDFEKGIRLAMQGSWTQQHHCSWACVDSQYPEDAMGPISMTSSNPDGTSRLMSKTESLSPVTMYPIGIIPLHKEHLFMWQLRNAMTSFPTNPQKPPRSNLIQGCVNDCFYVKRGKKIEEKLQPMLDNLTHADGSALFKVKRDEYGNIAPRIAPEVRWTYQQVNPSYSSWVYEQPEEINNNEPRFPGNFGHWLRSYIALREWRFITEPEGLGRGADDTYQTEIVPVIVKNKGAFLSGRGGTGKSWAIKSLKTAFEAEGYTVHVIALTHTAVANASQDQVVAETILHLLHTIMQTKNHLCAILVDEASQVPLSMQSTLLSLKWMGHVIVQMGDFAGQFMPIPDRAREHMLENLDTSTMMHDMVNGLHVKLRKFRRGTDQAHFDFVGSLYPHTGIELEDALMVARERYPARGLYFDGTWLCISHRSRIGINKIHNQQWDKPTGVFIKSPGTLTHTDNQPQDMWLRNDMILMAIMKSSDAICKNGVRYRLTTISKDCFTFHRVCDEDKQAGEPFTLTTKETAERMRLTYAITYFSSQARTIHSPLRLTDTGHVHYSLRHLIVGLGRAPEGNIVQVE